MEEIVKSIKYSRPKVVLLNESGIGVAEVAGRTCYDSFHQSENECVNKFPSDIELGAYDHSINDVKNSELLHQLAWVHHHHSIIEHATLSFLVHGISRGVLQEHARHRLQNISVKSSRYCMSGILNAFVSGIVKSLGIKEKGYLSPTAEKREEAKKDFIAKVLVLDILVTADDKYNTIEIGGMWEKLYFQLEEEKENFFSLSIAKSSLPLLKEDSFTSRELFMQLQEGKNKRNIGDPFKHIVTDNWKTDMVITFNLRSLKNYYDLRDSGSAWFQIRWLAEEMKKVTPLKYLKLIDKKHK